MVPLRFRQVHDSMKPRPMKRSSFCERGNTTSFSLSVGGIEYMHIHVYDTSVSRDVWNFSSYVEKGPSSPVESSPFVSNKIERASLAVNDTHAYKRWSGPSNAREKRGSMALEFILSIISSSRTNRGET